MKNSIIQLFFIILFCSCNPKTVYVFKDSRGVSKFELYKNGNYRYLEKTKTDHFSFFATYQTKDDSIVVFEYPDIDKLPYCFFDNSLILLEKSSNSKIKIQIRDRYTKENLALVNVVLLDENHRSITGKSSDFDGNVEVSSLFSFIEIQAVGYPKYRFTQTQINGHDFICEMESLKPGYMVSNGDFLNFLGCYMDYKLDTQGAYLYRDSLKYFKLN